MSRQVNSPSQWPKAAVAIFGTASISAASYLLKQPDIMLAMFPLLWIVYLFD